MEKIKIIQRIGNFNLALLFFCSFAFAGDVQFQAQVEQNQISQDESVTFHLIIKTDNSTRTAAPEFDAPDFEVVSQYNSISVNSQYDSHLGQFSVVNTQQLTKVLRPTKSGTLKIKNIRLDLGTQVIRSPDLTIQVGASGSSASSNQRSQQPNNKLNKRDTGNRAFVRAEVDKTTAYKGEQIIVSYYLYHQMKVINLQIDKFPILAGFLREDLEIPVMGQGLTSEPAQFKGEFYDRYLLARYAAYPLQEGKLAIDSIALKYNYYSNQHESLSDDDDPFLGVFRQLTARTAEGQSNRIEMEVLPLPEKDRPESFVGGVGDFTVISAVDRYEVHANEAVTLTVKVEGKGNLAAIQQPKTQWPDGIELYDSKGRSQSSKSGVGEKVFEFLLIPRVPGKLKLPPLEFGFFSSVQKKYYPLTTDPVELNILDPLPGSHLVPASKKAPLSLSTPSASTDEMEELKPLKGPFSVSSRSEFKTLEKVLYFSAASVFLLLGAGISVDTMKRIQQRKRKRRVNGAKNHKKALDQLRSFSQTPSYGASEWDVIQSYEKLTEIIFDALEDALSVSVRSLSREQMKQLFLEAKGLKANRWDQIASILEFADLVRFSSSSGGIADSSAGSQLPRWIEEAESVLQSLE